MTSTSDDQYRGVLRRLQARANDDAGISIIEVVAAVFIFMIISVGIAQGLVTTIRLAGDQQRRVTALSLASSDVDAVRGKLSVFDIDASTYDTTVDGTTYTITRSVEWVDANGSDVSCGTGDGTKLRVLRVNVDATWAGQMRPISPVNFDTVVAPDGSLHDEDLGVLMISVKDASGTGLSGVPVTLTATSAIPAGATVPTPTVTNSQGCSYAIGVPPANYNVTLTKTGFVSGDQKVSPVSKAVTILPGESASEDFQFDRAGTVPVTLTSPSGSIPSGTLRYPTTGADFTVVNGRGASTVTRGANLALFPSVTDPYTIIYGAYAVQGLEGAADPDLKPNDGCQSTNPLLWGAMVLEGDSLAAGSATSVVALPGQTAATVPVGAGYVKISTSSNSRAVTAKTTNPANTPDGDPGCGQGITLTFTGVNNGDVLVMPFGTWAFTSMSGSTNVVTKAEALSNVSKKHNLASQTTATVDPRKAG